MRAIALGPFVLAWSVVLAAVSYLSATLAGEWIARRRAIDIEVPLYLVPLLGLVVARIAFVVAYWSSYRSGLFAIIDIRDGGFSWTAGVVGALAAGVSYAIPRPATRIPLAAAVGAGLLTWMLGAAALNMLSNEPNTLPVSELATLQGTKVPLSSFSGTPLVVNLWASWCPPCRREMPVLRDAQARHSDIVFVFADQGEPAAAVQAYLERNQLALSNVLLDDKGTLGHFAGSAALPTTLFFEASGSLLDVHIGPLSAGSLAEHIDQLNEGEGRHAVKR